MDSVESNYEDELTDVIKDSDSNFVVEDEKKKKKNRWIHQILTNLTLVPMIRLSLLAILVIETNAIQ